MTATEVQEHRARAFEANKRAEAILKSTDGKPLSEEKRKEAEGHLDEADAHDQAYQLAQRTLERERKAAEVEAEAKSEEQRSDAGKPASTEALQREGYRAYLTHGSHYVTRARTEAVQAIDAWTRDHSASVDVEGGYVMAPMAVMNEILKAVDDNTFMRGLSRVLPSTAPGQSLGVPFADDNTLSFTWDSENTIAPPTDIALAGREFKPAGASVQVKFSRKLLAGNVVMLESYVNQRIGYQRAVGQEKAYMTGTGVGQPLGLFVATPNGISADRDIVSDAVNKIGYDDIVNMTMGVKQQHNANGTFMFSRPALKLVKLIKDSEQRPIWRMGLAPSDPPTIDGRPYVMSEFAPAGTGANGAFATNDYMGIFGDFDYYWICDSNFMVNQRLDELFALQKQVGIISTFETDGAPVLEEAFIRLKGK